MLSIKGHAELSHMEERIKMAFGLEAYPIALEILTETAVTGYLEGKAAVVICQKSEATGIDPKALLQEILAVLQHDGYLE